MLIIHGRKNSSNVQKVVWALNEMGVSYERLDVGGEFGVVNEPPYLAMNPNARVPTMEEDGFILWESNAIVRYLTAKHDTGGLYPSDPQVRASADRWMDWQHTSVGQYITPIFWGLVRTLENERDLALIESSRLGMIAAMQILNNNLSNKNFVAGEAFTMGDIPLAIHVYRWFRLIQDRPRMEHLENWYDRLAKRSAFKTHVLDIPFT